METINNEDGSTYLGEFKDGKYHGYGRLTFKDGAYYAGQFKNGDYNGKGTLVHSVGTKIVGTFKNGSANGDYTMHLPNGKVLELNRTGNRITDKNRRRGYRSLDDDYNTEQREDDEKIKMKESLKQGELSIVEIYCPKCGHKFSHQSSVGGKIKGAGGGVISGAILGGKIGITAGPLGAIAGTVPGAILGALFGTKIGNHFDKALCPKCKTSFNSPK